MKIENTKGFTRYYDYEIDKAISQNERGISFYNYFKYKAQKFKYGEMAYYDILKKEIEDYEQRGWDYLIEMGQLDPIEVYEILEDVKKIKKTLDLLASQSINESPFCVLEWATIFYYADETKLLPENRTIKARIEQFINKHKIDTTYKYFRAQYYEAKKRINDKNDYPVSKLELIIPFLKENYKQTVTKVENDIIFLKENTPEY